MATAMRVRDLERALLRAGCVVAARSGPHTKWACPCGEHSANVPRHKVISPGVVRSTIDRMACLPEGWLR